MRDRFWETKTLEELDDEEWEALCDGCAQCCRLRFRDSGSNQVVATTLVCALLDIPSRRCTKYPKRHELVPDCVELTPTTARTFDWLPETCAYRRVAHGRPLEDWHPLVSGSTESVTDAGVSVTDKVVSAANVHPDDIASNILKWV